MDHSNVTYLSFLAANLVWLALCAVLAYKSLRGLNHWSLVAAAVVNTVWLACYLFGFHFQQLSLSSLFLVEVLRYCTWIFTLIAILQNYNRARLPQKTATLAAMAAILGVLVFGAIALFELRGRGSLVLFSWSGVILSVIGLVSVEQLYRNISHNRQDKLVCLNIAAFFVVDLGYHAHSLIFSGFSVGMLEARAVTATAAALVIMLAVLVLPHRKSAGPSLALSRPITFYSTSLTAAGVLIFVLAIGGYYVKVYSGEWGTVIYSFLLFSTSMLIAITLASSTARDSLKVRLVKHLFKHKYDYRMEWLKLINFLSQPTEIKDAPKKAIAAVTAITKSPAGALWLKKGNQFTLSHQRGIDTDIGRQEIPSECDFCTVMREKEWIFIPDSAENPLRNQYNELIPEELAAVPGIWLIMPLLVERELYGFILLTEPKADPSLTWEDRDLLKTVGRQLGYYLEHLYQHEQLIAAEQFDTFQKLSAFVMHDLKNLIAQQALVVTNAKKHKHNPVFIEDAMSTIKNSVDRMQVLLKKLRINEAPNVRTFSIQEVLQKAAQDCQAERPRPSLRFNGVDAQITADHDQLQMTFTNLLKNAQDATDAGGFIDVTLDVNKDKTSIIIEDNGQGMDEDFIRNRLFKPFDTTKAGKGMGIGVYLAHEYITSLDGELSVESTPNEGSTFTITLPTQQM